MKKELSYELDIQLFGEEENEVVEEVKSVIDLGKHNDDKPEEELSELDKIKAELEVEREERRKAEERAKRNKTAADKAMKDRAEAARTLKEQTEALVEPNEKILEYEQKLAEYELQNKKNDALYGFVETVGINREHAAVLVGALYHEDTNEVSVPDLMEAFGLVIKDVMKSSKEAGYNLRDTEIGTNKPRSYGSQQEDVSPEAEALRRFKSRRNVK